MFMRWFRKENARSCREAVMLCRWSAPPREGMHGRLTVRSLAFRPLRSGSRSWRLSEWSLAARLVDDVELAVQVVAE